MRQGWRILCHCTWTPLSKHALAESQVRSDCWAAAHSARLVECPISAPPAWADRCSTSCACAVCPSNSTRKYGVRRIRVIILESFCPIFRSSLPPSPLTVPTACPRRRLRPWPRPPRQPLAHHMKPCAGWTDLSGAMISPLPARCQPLTPICLSHMSFRRTLRPLMTQPPVWTNTTGQRVTWHTASCQLGGTLSPHPGRPMWRGRRALQCHGQHHWMESAVAHDQLQPVATLDGGLPFGIAAAAAAACISGPIRLLGRCHPGSRAAIGF